MFVLTRSKWYLAFISIIVVASCINVRRNYHVRIPPGSNAAERSQQSVFELRNTILASVSSESIQELLNDFKAEYSNKEFVDKTQSAKPPLEVLGGKLETSVRSITTSVCIKNLGLKTAGKGPMSFSLEMQSCGIKIRVSGAAARLRFESITEKPVKITINEFNLTDTSGIKTFTLSGELSVDSTGELRIAEGVKIEGLDQLGIPKNYKYDAVSENTDGLANRLRKSQDEVTEAVVRNLFEFAKGYVTSSIIENATKSFQKYSQKINAKQIGLSQKTFRVKLGTSTFDMSGRLVGIFGDKNVTAAVSLTVNETDGNSNRGICKIEGYDNFPDPLASWMRGNPLVKYFDEFFNVPEDIGVSRNAQGAVEVPISVVNFLLWKALGSKGSCAFSLANVGNNGSDAVSLTYDNAWMFAIDAKSNAAANGQYTEAKMSLNIPKIRLNFSERINAQFQESLRKEGFLRQNEALNHEVTIADLKYSLIVSAADATGAKPFKVSVSDEDVFLPRENIKASDVVDDLIRNLRKIPDFSSRNLDAKQAEISQILLNSILNTYLAQKLRDMSLEIVEKSSSATTNLAGVKVSSDGIWIRIKTKIPLQGSPALNKIEAQTTLVRENILDLSTDEDLQANRAEAVNLFLENLGIPSLVGAKELNVSDRTKKIALSAGLTCGALNTVVLPVSETLSGTVEYINCVSPKLSVEHRFHSEFPVGDAASAESKVVYSRSLVQDVNPDQSHGAEILGFSFDVFLKSLGKPKVESVFGRSFNAKWDLNEKRIVAMGFCQGADLACPTNQRRITSIEQWNQ